MNPERIPLHPLESLDPVLAPQAVWRVLEAVADPEIPVLTLADLGVLRDVIIDEQGLLVVLTPTYSGCPAMHAMEQAVRQTLEANGYTGARIEMRLAPAWTTSWMSENGREKLRAYGIAPPRRFAEKGDIACPQCGSANTRCVSQFGSTACKAMYQCQDCREPFDYFKCI